MSEPALGHDPMETEPVVPCCRCGHVHEGACSRTYTGYPLPDVRDKPPSWAKPLAPPAPWGRHLR